MKAPKQNLEWNWRLRLLGHALIIASIILGCGWLDAKAISYLGFSHETVAFVAGVAVAYLAIGSCVNSDLMAGVLALLMLLPGAHFLYFHPWVMSEWLSHLVASCGVVLGALFIFGFLA